MPEGGVTSEVDLNDSDFLKLEEVLRYLNRKRGEKVPLEPFRQEIIDRFAHVGFKVNVRFYTTNVEGVYIPEIAIVSRIDGEFDPDQQVWEATQDILGLGEGGVIPSGAPGLHIVKDEHGHSH
jgi:hypothetical protein